MKPCAAASARSPSEPTIHGERSGRGGGRNHAKAAPSSRRPSSPRHASAKMRQPRHARGGIEESRAVVAWSGTAMFAFAWGTDPAPYRSYRMLRAAPQVLSEERFSSFLIDAGLRLTL